jgi:hypothetical protein
MGRIRDGAARNPEDAERTNECSVPQQKFDDYCRKDLLYILLVIDLAL